MMPWVNKVSMVFVFEEMTRISGVQSLVLRDLMRHNLWTLRLIERGRCFCLLIERPARKVWASLLEVWKLFDGVSRVQSRCFSILWLFSSCSETKGREQLGRKCWAALTVLIVRGTAFQVLDIACKKPH